MNGSKFSRYSDGSYRVCFRVEHAYTMHSIAEAFMSYHVDSVEDSHEIIRLAKSRPWHNILSSIKNEILHFGEQGHGDRCANRNNYELVDIITDIFNSRFGDA